MKLDRRQFLQAAPAVAAQAPAAAPFDPSFDPIKTLLKGKEPVTWLFTGDSITHGALHTMGWRSYPEHFAERVRWELRRVRDIVVNTGISGDRMARMVPDSEWRVHRFRPQVVSLMMGMNDCTRGEAGRQEYREFLDRFVGELRERASQLIVNTPNPIYPDHPSSRQRADLPAYVEILRRFAADNKLALVDHYEHWTRTRKDSYELLYLLNDASIHPNNYGHAYFANLLFQKLGIYDPAGSRTCRLFVP